MILDLEDAVTADRRGGARIEVARHLASGDAGGAAVGAHQSRSQSADALADLTAVIAARPDGILLPKPESVDDLWRVDHWLEALEAANGIARGAIAMLPIVTENARAVLSLGQLGTAARTSRRPHLGRRGSRGRHRCGGEPHRGRRLRASVPAARIAVPAGGGRRRRTGVRHDRHRVPRPGGDRAAFAGGAPARFLRAARHPPGADRTDPQGVHAFARGDQLGGARARSVPLVPGPRCRTARRPHARHAAHAAGGAHPRRRRAEPKD